MTKSRHILITGGHLSPALATITVLQAQDWQISYVGSKYQSRSKQQFTDEYQAITNLDIPFHQLTTGRLHRHSLMAAILSLLLVPWGVFQAWNIISKQKPDIVLSFGSYLSVPIVLVAFTRRIPIVTHEQTRQAGIANRLNGYLANRIAISFEDSLELFPADKTILTGNPTKIKSLPQNPQPFFSSSLSKRPTIYITGGHQGSTFINQLVLESLPILNDSYNIIHSFGLHPAQQKYWKQAQKLQSSLSKPEAYYPARYFNSQQLSQIYLQSEFVVSRSGANTCAELVHLNIPSLLIPLPGGQQNEQLKNALLLQDIGIAQVKQQAELTMEEFIAFVKYSLEHLERFKINQDLAQKHFPKDADQQLVTLLNQVCPS